MKNKQNHFDNLNINTKYNFTYNYLNNFSTKESSGKLNTEFGLINNKTEPISPKKPDQKFNGNKKRIFQNPEEFKKLFRQSIDEINFKSYEKRPKSPKRNNAFVKYKSPISNNAFNNYENHEYEKNND